MVWSIFYMDDLIRVSSVEWEHQMDKVDFCSEVEEHYRRLLLNCSQAAGPVRPTFSPRNTLKSRPVFERLGEECKDIGSRSPLGECADLYLENSNN